MAKKKMTRDVPLPSSDGMFGGIKGRSLKAATPGVPTATIRDMHGYFESKDRKVLADQTGRAIEPYNSSNRYEISSSGEEFGANRSYRDLRAVNAAAGKNRIAQCRQQIYKKVDAKMAAKKK